MFRDATSFNQSLNSWDVGRLIDCPDMFRDATAFNGNVTGWTLVFLLDTQNMFRGASSFDQNLGGWNIITMKYAANMFLDSGLTKTNWDAILTGWYIQSVQNNVAITATPTHHSASVASYISHLTVTHLWTITDGGEDP
jgi:hypothetical protein